MSESEKPAVPPVDGDALRAVALGFIADVIEYQFNRADDDTHGEVLERIENRAREIATAHGYDGTRWPAMAEGQPSANPPQSQGRLTYLACPYSHADRAVRVARFEAANRAASVLMREGHHVFSPISHTHPIAEAGGLPLGWDFWEAFDRAYLAASDRVIVLRVEGWHLSKGVTAERRIAGEMGLPVSYIDPVPAPAAPPAAEGAMRDALAFAGNLVCGEYCGGDHYIASHGHSTECRRISAALLGHRPQPPADPHPPADAARETP